MCEYFHIILYNSITIKPNKTSVFSVKLHPNLLTRLEYKVFSGGGALGHFGDEKDISAKKV